jgi:hypothetical protein
MAGAAVGSTGTAVGAGVFTTAGVQAPRTNTAAIRINTNLAKLVVFISFPLLISFYYYTNIFRADHIFLPGSSLFARYQQK